MTLITHVDGPQGKGREYMTLVEQFHPDGTLEGTTSLFDHAAASVAGHDSDDEGVRVLFAYAEPNPAQTSSTEWPRAFARPVTPGEWAAAIRDHLATVPSAND